MPVSRELLQSLKGLRIQVLHPPDAEGKVLIEHLNRIGCTCEATWPLPEEINPAASVVIIAIEPSHREQILKLFRPVEPLDPALLAVISFEDPSTVQIVLECGALGVIERPIRPFGLLTNLMITRSIWLERQNASKRIRKLERRVRSSKQILRAKEILMQTREMTEDAAYECIRQQAMAKRISMDELADAIIAAHTLLTNNP
ncbi:ANTAR domain protein with unknown sensor [Hyphomicrobium denitrificans ATCC 51888]|uniref:ANTAR domain-containing protein n=1 Tax=Hyphomicrobium denitrificans (strain ATCC 51888 / DSM 1869 / NCIMB 11706 / TK 0415) TaxID=582899 RepID=D8JUI4_HYPDA|nr:ANTAR domain protein with unknown sensor [Hyphomicrobium denitrificans ATCC 51888]